MTWIDTRPFAKADHPLQQVYQRIYALYPEEYSPEETAIDRADGSADRIVESHSLLPEVMEPIFTAFGRLLSPELPLTRTQQEMICTLVSSLNHCLY